MNRDDEKLRRHQSVLYELLKVVDSICRKHDISYMLFAGSALGAVRHKGFIPWDDDLDVVMLRPDYERFLEVAEKELDHENYFLQKEHSDHWPMFFSKLRKNNTTCLERYIPKDPLLHQGIYIDIFPCDNLRDGKIPRKLQFYASKVIIAKSLAQRGYLTDSVIKKLFMWLCHWVPMNPLRRMVLAPDAADTQWVHTFLGGSSRYEKGIYPRKWFSEKICLPFEDEEYPVSGYYDEMLTAMYGDYMTPLHESQRGCKVHAEFVDVENPYTQYLEFQRSMDFAEHTKSIR